MRSRELLLCVLGFSLLAAGLSGKSVDISDRWTLDIPDDWKVVDESVHGGIQVYSYGIEPGPGKHVPVFLAKRGKGYEPDPVHGISFSFALEPLAYIVIPGDVPVQLQIAGHAVKAYRRVADGYVSVGIPRSKLIPKAPDEPTPARAVVINIGAKDDAELTKFLEVLGTLRLKSGLAQDAGSTRAPQSTTGEARE